MAQKFYEEQNIKNIAKAIREMSGGSAPLSTSQMSTAITNLQNFILFKGSEDKITGEYISNSDGSVVSDSNSARSDYIPINTEKMSIYFATNWNATYYNAYYDENKDFISNFSLNKQVINTLTPPSNAKYLRISCDPTQINDCIIWEGDIKNGYYGEKFLYKINNTATRLAEINGWGNDIDFGFMFWDISDDRYYMLLTEYPIAIQAKAKFTRTLGTTSPITGVLIDGLLFDRRGIRNSGAIRHLYGMDSMTSVDSHMGLGIPYTTSFDSKDVSTQEGEFWYVHSPTSTKFFWNSPTYLYNYDTSHVHPVLQSYYKNNGKCSSLFNLFNTGFTESQFTALDYCTAVLPSGFDPSTIDKGYLLYTTNNVWILIVGDSSYDGVFVNANGKLDSTNGQTSYCNSQWNSAAENWTYYDRPIEIYARTSRPPFAEGNQDNIPDNVIYNTQDILDTNGNVVQPANCTLSEFKTKLKIV